MRIKLEIFYLTACLVGHTYGRAFDYKKDNDLYQIGDMIFSRKMNELLRNQSSKAGSSQWNPSGQSYDITWPKNTVPYTFDKDVPQDKKSKIMSAMKDIMDAVPNCWKFVPKKSTDKHWVEYNTVNMPDSCSSSIGNLAQLNKPPQYTNFGAEFCSYGSMVHELFHTLGFQHEFTRNDRDQYIQVYKERIPDGKWHNFKLDKDKNYPSDTYGVPYNFDSLMHYGFRLVGMIKNPVMRNLGNKAAYGYDLPDDKVGQRYKMSYGDLQLLIKKGNCKDPGVKSYPITGADPNDIGLAEDIPSISCTYSECSRTKGTCPPGQTTTYDKCTGRGKCHMYQTVCCSH